MALHVDLVAIGVNWLKAQGCDVVLAEPALPRGERPDAIGWRRSDASSILIEAKAARRDLQKEWSLTDPSRKPFRYEPNAAGAERYYLAPPGIVPDALLEASGWGLLIPTREGVLRVRASQRFDVNFQTELQILIRAASDPQYGQQRPRQIQFRFPTPPHGTVRR